eukprot:TRINITY_DN46925_c0_g1_i1.p1 TRINITY_DN46925_c0_g1~~TRINITY_DN46925_c0_g1_i1.p1  ORF type:complete len:414 (-),score=31.10 TRINITY_DN46925_c0_g1_i1:285-1526(-)
MGAAGGDGDGTEDAVLSNERIASYGSFPHTDPTFEQEEDAVIDTMTYSMSWLKTWGVLVAVRGTVWESPGLWMLMMKLMLISICIAFMAYNLLPDPGLLDVSKFTGIVTVMSLFVSLMLSFFLSNAVSRWLKSVDGFEQIFNSIRMLSMQLHALGICQERLTLCLRYALMSAHFLIYDLSTVTLTKEKKDACLSQMWNTYVSAKSDYAHITEKEHDVLERHSGDRPSQMWLWISTLLGRMAMDGQIPGMATPTYGRIMDLAQDAQEGIRTVRTAVLVQMPYRYVHLLAFLVHLECILMAVNLGLSIGVSYHGIRQYVDHYYYKLADGMNDSQITPLTEQIQTVLIETLKGFVAPLLFQAFLDIGVAISSPFAGSQSSVPLERIIRDIEKDLAASNGLATTLPSWEKPVFKIAQ